MAIFLLKRLIIIKNNRAQKRHLFPYQPLLQCRNCLGHQYTISCVSSVLLPDQSHHFVDLYPAKGPIRTPSTDGSPMVVDRIRFPKAILTSSTRFSGTIIRRIAVHFCPAFVVISRATSLINKIKLRHIRCDIIPKTVQFNESASIVNGTASFNKTRMRF